MADGKPRMCKDCTAAVLAGEQAEKTLQRPAPHSGPRCTTHHRLERRRVLQAGRDRWRRNTYGLEPADYAKLYEHQGRRCAICRRATGATKQLAVDHDHTVGAEHPHPPTEACSLCLRGLLCGPCNSMMAHARDDPEMFHRAIRYLSEWPAATAGI